ncbi:restriction endonuclease subunit M [Halovibrio variabilis]|uniref:Cytosine-specific methyltransferase n=1 Tax=Halovibrio variabilis TaxID=31910 RepID=A0A511USS2_9GAMM|nr:DNA cytosine methyltransferase [Halovibrio variabilis]GEN28748.1 restriction endonuclease subunit M [Halovibrio variabilis]
MTICNFSKIAAVDLFCGVGGLAHGLLRAGIEVRAGVDIDSHCKYPFEKNNKALFVEKNVSEIKKADIDDMFGQHAGLKLIAGCAPCQPFSTYSRSKKDKARSEQWSLVLQFGRLVEEASPDLVVMENVPQLPRHQVFQEFLEQLKGYYVWWSIVDCQNFGIPQTRKRLVLLASKLGRNELYIPNDFGGKITVRQAIGSLEKIQAGRRNKHDPLHVSSSLSEINIKRIKASKPGGTWRDWPESLQANCHRKKTGSTFPSVYGRMEWDAVGPTITTQCFGYGNGRFGHPEQDRAISLREAAMLQTFPRDYRFIANNEDVKFSRLGRLIGNAVPVRLGEVIAKSLLRHISSYEKLNVA